MKRICIVLLALMCLLLASCSCSHEQWAEANCEQPKTCVRCGETEGAPAGHIWKPATLEAPKTCTICQKTEGISLLEEKYPSDRSRCGIMGFSFKADEFPALLNRELKNTGYTARMVENNGGEADYELVREGETKATITCRISFDGNLVGGIYKYLSVYMDIDSTTTPEQKDLHEEIMSAVFRTVYIPAQGTTYDQLIQSAEPGTSYDGSPAYYGNINYVDYIIAHRSDMSQLMIILGA